MRIEKMQGFMVVSFDSSTEAGEYLKIKVAKGDVVLIKGSQSSRMERVSATLLAEPSRSAEFLVRQEPEWLARYGGVDKFKWCCLFITTRSRYTGKPLFDTIWVSTAIIATSTGVYIGGTGTYITIH